MQEIKISNKQEYLDKKYPFSSIPSLRDKRYCMQCKNEIVVGEYKVFKDEQGKEIICCPNAPACNGTVMDWYKLH